MGACRPSRHALALRFHWLQPRDAGEASVKERELAELQEQGGRLLFDH